MFAERNDITLQIFQRLASEHFLRLEEEALSAGTTLLDVGCGSQSRVSGLSGYKFAGRVWRTSLAAKTLVASHQRAHAATGAPSPAPCLSTFLRKNLLGYACQKKAGTKRDLAKRKTRRQSNGVFVSNSRVRLSSSAKGA